MKASLLIVMGVVVLVAGSSLAIMNNACKSSHHGCAATRHASLVGSGPRRRSGNLAMLAAMRRAHD
jgi:hypothetical protein